jgi:hypothetical protein
VNQNPSSIPPVLNAERAPRLDPGLAEARFAMAEMINCIEEGVPLEDMLGAFRELGRGCFGLVAGRGADRFCSGCQARVHAWDALPFVGFQLEGDQAFELRNCTHCGSTLSAEVPEHELDHARLWALEHYVLQGEPLGRVVELWARDGRLCLDVQQRDGHPPTLRDFEGLSLGVQAIVGGS